MRGARRRPHLDEWTARSREHESWYRARAAQIDSVVSSTQHRNPAAEISVPDRRLRPTTCRPVSDFNRRLHSADSTGRCNTLKTAYVDRMEPVTPPARWSAPNRYTA